MHDALEKMTASNLIVKSVIGTLLIISFICLCYFGAGVVMRAIADGRVSQSEDKEYAEIDCSNISTSKGHRINGDACNKARARKDLPSVLLPLYDSGDFAVTVVSFLYGVLLRNLFIALIASVVLFGTSFYYFQPIMAAGRMLLRKEKPY